MNEPLLHYFAYGSNLHRGRMVARVPSARTVGTAPLDGHALRFHKRSLVDGSGKCDALLTGNPADRVYGAVYAIRATERSLLDAFEGPGYAVVERTVRIDGRELPVFLYCARSEAIADGLAPYDWYHGFVVQGARQHGLPGDYVTRLEATATRPDPDAARAAAEFRLLHGDD